MSNYEAIAYRKYLAGATLAARLEGVLSANEIIDDEMPRDVFINLVREMLDKYRTEVAEAAEVVAQNAEAR